MSEDTIRVLYAGDSTEEVLKRWSEPVKCRFTDFPDPQVGDCVALSIDDDLVLRLRIVSVSKADDGFMIRFEPEFAAPS